MMIITFDGYHSPLKRMWRQGKLPHVKKGLYGDILTQENLSLEHLLPVSKGGKTTMDNLVLASKEKNSLRGNRDLKEVLSRKQAMDYILQFVHEKGMREYMKDLFVTFKRIGVM